MKTITPQRVLDLDLDLDQETSLNVTRRNRFAALIARIDIVQLSLDSFALLIFVAAVFFLLA